MRINIVSEDIYIKFKLLNFMFQSRLYRKDFFPFAKNEITVYFYCGLILIIILMRSMRSDYLILCICLNEKLI